MLQVGVTGRCAGTHRLRELIRDAAARAYGLECLIIDGNPLENILQVSDRKNHRLVVKNGKAVV